MATKTTWGSSSYSTERDATRACILDWLTASSGLLRDLPTSVGPTALARELFDMPDGRRWISIGTDEDGQPLVEGPYRCTQEDAHNIIAALLDERDAEVSNAR